MPGFDYPPGYTAFQFVLRAASSPRRSAGVFTGFGVARDFEIGFGTRLLLARSAARADPPRLRRCRASSAGAFTMIVITVVALLAGMNVSGSGVDLFGLYGLALLMNAAAALWGVGVALRFRSIQAGPLMQTPVFLILFLAPVYVPLPLLSGWVHAVASVNPATALLDSGRDLLAGNTITGLAFGLVLLLIFLFGLWSVRGLRSAEAAGGG